MRWEKKERDPFYGSAVWRNLRLMALQRDHYWCQRCGKRTATTVHHLIPREERPDLALDLDNLQSICPRCHNQLHPEKGAKNAKGPPKPGIPGDIRVIEIK